MKIYLENLVPTHQHQTLVSIKNALYISKRKCEVAVKLQCSFTTLPYRKVQKVRFPVMI